MDSFKPHQPDAADRCEIALETGFEDPGYFSYCFKQRCGMTPKNFRQGAEG
ncbi:MAG: helix-turn-helix domain-containing protein [Candidatus Spyradocola sp.]